MDKCKLFLYQPEMTSYRAHYFNELSKNCTIEGFSDYSSSGKGFCEASLDFPVKYGKRIAFAGGRVFWHQGFLSCFIRGRYDVAFVTANPRNIALWFFLILAFLKRVPVLLHGQGLYNKSPIRSMNKILYVILLSFSNRYLCYTELSRLSLGWLPKRLYAKVVVVENAIYNHFPVVPSEKEFSELSDVLFVGRLREGVGLENLADAILSLDCNRSVRLHVVGEGENFERYKNLYSDVPDRIIFYGSIYDDKEISKLSKICLVGCYPGRAGLSVVHYMSMSLIPLVHSDIKSHMGPEPSYIMNGYNGYTFDGYDSDSIENALRKLMATTPDSKFEVASNAYLTYVDLNSPSMSEKIYDSVISEKERGYALFG